MSTEVWIAIGAVSVFVGGAFVYAMLMVFFPEWVGIAGKTAQATERSHRGESPVVDEPPSLLDRMQGDAGKKPKG